MLDAAYLASAREADRHERARRTSATARRRSGGTVYLTAADADGMMVSFIQSNYMGFGSGVVVPGTGISLQNRGSGFSAEPGHPNDVGPGKRPFHTIIPGFVTQGRRAGDELRRDGRLDAGAGPRAGDGAPRRLRPERRRARSTARAFASCRAWTSTSRRRSASGPSPSSRAAATASSPSASSTWTSAARRSSGDCDDGYETASDPRRDSLGVGF